MPTNVPWYAPEFTGDRGRAMVDTAKLIANSPENQARLDESLVHARMYEGRPIQSIYGFGGRASRSGAFDINDFSTWNVLRSICSAGGAQVGRSKPRPRFLTNGANYKTKQKAKKLQKFCDGLFKDAKVYQHTQRALSDGCVFPTGNVEIFVSHDKIRVQRVFDSEIFYEYNPYGESVTMYRRRFQNRYKLRKQFGDDEAKKAAINAAPDADPAGSGESSNLIEVWEAYHLPSYKGADDGLRVIALGGHDSTLLEVAWTKTYWPIVSFTWEPALIGSGGKSIAALLAPIQTSINKRLSRIDKAQRIMCTPGLWFRKGSKPTGRVTNDVGRIVESAEPPQPLVFPALPPEFYKSLADDVSRAYEEVGISRDTSQGSKDAGVTSAIAIRESLDIGQARIAPIIQRWEQAHVDLARIMVDLARDLYSDGKAYSTSTSDGKFLESVDFKECDLTEDEYDIECEAASLLPTTAAGRIDTVQDLVKSGVWSSDRAAASLDDLDPEAEMSKERAAEKNIERQIDLMLDGKAQQPDKFTDFGVAIKLGALAINEAETEGADEKGIDLIRRYVDACVDLQKRAQPQPPAPPAPANAAPAPAQPPAMAA